MTIETGLPASVALDVTRPNVARVYDCLLGGKDNYDPDREAAGKLLAAIPRARHMALCNRHFLARAVQYLVSEGVFQFIDYGTGLPTVGNVHEVADRAAAAAGHDGAPRVVYSDHDPLVCAHGRALLAGSGRTTVIEADLRYPEMVLDHPRTHALIDFDQPVAVLYLAVLHFVPHNDPFEIVRRVMEPLVPGSHLVISHGLDTKQTRSAAEGYEAAPVTLRTRRQILEMFQGLEVVPPGVVPIDQWRPKLSGIAGSAEPLPVLGGVARLGETVR